MRSESLSSRHSRALRAALALALFSLAAMQGLAYEIMLVLPKSGYRPVGDPGGPFPAAKYTITNRSAFAMDWATTTTVKWLTITPASGNALASGALTTVTVSVNAAANGLLPGNYSGSFTLMRKNSGEIQARSVILTVRGVWTRLTDAAPWGPREGLASASFKGKLWVIGGRNAAGAALSDVWSSPDGAAWTRETADAGWTPRTGHRVVVYNNKMWLLGGGTPQVWSTGNGVDWTTVTAAAPWGNRTDLGACVFDGLLRVAGGEQDGFGTHDSWRSINGKDWLLGNASAPWLARSGHGLLGNDYLGRMYLLGGHGGASFFNDVWWNIPESNLWIQSGKPSPWSPRTGLSTAYYAGNIWLLGGTNATTLFNEAWVMQDNSLNWTPAPDPIPWAGRTDFAAQVFGQRLFVLGGLTADGPAADVWALFAPLQISKLAVGPMAGFAAAGNQGGPFTPVAKTYTITNTGGAPLNWQAVLTNASWVTLSKSGGALDPGAGDTLTVSINASANSLPARYSGYTGVLQFKNLVNGQGNTQVGLKLDVAGVPPRIAVTPLNGWTTAGDPGGPFTPATKTYTIENVGGAPLDWQAVLTNATWASLSKSGGTLPPGASDTVTISVNASANALTPKDYGYTGMIQFKNLVNGYGNAQVGLKLNIAGTPPRIGITPGTGFNPVGPYGGPFTPASLTYTIKNGGSVPLDWSVSTDATWCVLSKTGGAALAPGASDTVTASISALGMTLLPGIYGYSGTLLFKNLTNTYGNLSIPIKLTVTGDRPQLNVTPSSVWTITGPPDGPFSPLTRTYTLENSGGAPLDWEVDDNAANITESKNSGTLAPHAKVTVTATATITSTDLTPGTYDQYALIYFRNITNGVGPGFQRVWLVVTPP